jgi:hypothetical protein
MTNQLALSSEGGVWNLDPEALVANAEEHLGGGGALGGRRLGGVSELGAEDLQRAGVELVVAA